MPASRIRANYDELASISRSFQAEAEATQRTLRELRSRMQTLEGGDWVGRGARAFYAEMNDSVLPSLTRLQKALAQAASVTTRVERRVRQAEADAARVLDGRGVASEGSAASGPSGAAGGSDGAAASGSVGPNGSGGSGSNGGGGGAAAMPAWQQKNPALTRDPESLFKDDYMRGMIDRHFQGENSGELRDVMNTLYNNPTGQARDQALQRLADIRGRPVDEIRAEYDKYMQLRDRADARGYDREALKQETTWKDGLLTAVSPRLGGAYVALSTHPDFMGSTNQLRYGQVVGDAYGIDPAFGALLNPSGGLVGPGNAAVDAGDTAVSYHGIFHDAAGYMLNAQGDGPGYDYLHREGRDPTSPLTGQRSGIRHWGELTGDNGFMTRTEARVMDGVVSTVDTVSGAWKGIKDIF